MYNILLGLFAILTLVCGRSITYTFYLPASYSHSSSTSSAYESIQIHSSKGTIDARYYKTPNSTNKAVIFVSGAGGGWGSPYYGMMYPSIAKKLQKKGVASLQVKYRRPANMEESVFDAMEGLKYLKKQGITKAGIVGWSFGGGVVCQTAGRDNTHTIKVAVTFATQSLGCDKIANADGVASLFIHGTEDTTLSKWNSEFAYELAPDPKKLKIVKDGHSFWHKNFADEIEKEAGKWLEKYLVD